MIKCPEIIIYLVPNCKVEVLTYSVLNFSNSDNLLFLCIKALKPNQKLQNIL